MGTGEILAAYRAQREKRAREMAAQEALDGSTKRLRPSEDGPMPAGPFHDAPDAPAQQAPTGSGVPSAGHPSGGQASAKPTGTPSAPPHVPQAPGPRPGLPSQGPRSGSTVQDPAPDAAQTLETITFESLGLEERLHTDRLLRVRGRPIGRGIGIGILLLGVLVMLADRRYVQTRGLGVLVTQALVPVWQVGLLLVVVGLGLLLVFWVLPTEPRPGFPVPEDQREAWQWVRTRLKRLRVATTTGWALVAFCVAVAAYGVVVPDADAALPYVGLAAVLGLVGAGVLLGAQAKRRPLRYLLAQTMLLAALEKAGVTVGPATGRDERVGPVLRHLDRMLGSLPDDAVQEFLAAPEAQTYLRLMEEYAEP